jgi:hypothetical protein
MSLKYLFASITLGLVTSASLSAQTVETATAVAPVTQPSAPVNQEKKQVNLTASESIIDPALKGMSLFFSEQSKMINVELPSGEFLEINFKLPYFVPPKDSFLNVDDIKSLYELSETLDAIQKLPTQEFIQPYTQAKLSKVIAQLQVLAKNYESRLYTFSLTEADLKTLSDAKKQGSTVK